MMDYMKGVVHIITILSVDGMHSHDKLKIVANFYVIKTL